MSVFNSVEFYVIAVVIAAAIVGFMAKNSSPGPVRQILLPGQLIDTECDMPAVEFDCRPDGSVTMTRHGLVDITDRGAVSVAITVKGFEVAIEERLTHGVALDATVVNAARFELDFMGSEHYFITYTSPALNLFCALTLHNRAGIHTFKPLQ